MKPDAQSQMNTLITDACHEVERQGNKASDRAVQLAAFHWLAEKLTSQTNNPHRRSLRWAERIGPWTILVGLLIYLVERGFPR